MNKNLIDIKQRFLKFVIDSICDLPKQLDLKDFDRARKMERAEAEPHLKAGKIAGFTYATQTRVLSAKVAFIGAVVVKDDAEYDGIPSNIFINIQEVSGSKPMRALFNEALNDLSVVLNSLPGVISVRFGGTLF